MPERLISYAQNGEDVVLWRAFRDQECGFYIDVGANDPVLDSVTKLFYDNGWKGLNVEPQPLLFAELEKVRPRDINLNIGLADVEGSLELHELPDTAGLSTFSPDLINHYMSESRKMRVRHIPVRTLADVCGEYVREPIDFMKIDVEGYEKEVLVGADWDTFRPRVIVIERTFPERWETLLADAKYVKVQYDGINDFFVRHEDLAVLGPIIEQPATTVLDSYDPYHYVRQLHPASGARLRDRLRQDLRDSLQAMKQYVRR